MLTDKPLQYISATLQHWYHIHKRNLPWRDTRDPYLIWISEIILQQTRVAQGYNYFVRFTLQFPDIKTLATANEEDILKCWQGLGYYSRARNLHAAAKQIMQQHNGIFPQAYNDILQLKGVGDYTAAAIASFAFQLPHAVVDGNVYRFLSRFFGIQTPINSSKGKQEFYELANKLIDIARPDLHNQAIMEFGALQCIPVSPDCSSCPLQAGCFAFENSKIAFLPVKDKTTKVTHRYFYHFILDAGNDLFIHKRTSKDIWQNLYEFPLFECNSPTELPDIMASEWFHNLSSGKNIKISGQSSEIKHILSHQVIHAKFYTLCCEPDIKPPLPYIRIGKTELARYPISRLTEKFLENV